MIQATVTQLILNRTDGGTPFALARSQQLVSSLNRTGEVRFNLEPPGWTHGRAPHIGQVVVLGKLTNATKPHTRHNRWRAEEVCTAFAANHYSPRRASAPTVLVVEPEELPVWARVLAVFGMRSRLRHVLGA